MGYKETLRSIVSGRTIELMKRHNVSHWRCGFFDSISIGGFVDSSDNVLFISRQFIECPDINYKDVEQLILHEIAHIIAGPENHHNEKWWKVARRIGYTRPTMHCKYFGNKTMERFIYSCKRGCKFTCNSTKKRCCRKHKIRMRRRKNPDYKHLKYEFSL